MPPSPAHIRELLSAYLDRHPGERHILGPLGPLLEAVPTPSGAVSRAVLAGHITCTAAVLDHEGRVLHVRPPSSGGLPLLPLLPSGRAAGRDATLMATAVREVHEKTGIPPARLCQSAVFCHEPADIEVHPVKGEPALRRYDFRFVFHLVRPPDERAGQDGEFPAALWLPLDQVASPTLREKLLDADVSAPPEPVNASVIIHDGAGRYLLHPRDQREGIWEPGVFSLLGGGRVPGDSSLEATLLRELGEEVPEVELSSLEPYTVEETTSVDGLSVPVQTFSAVWKGHPDDAGLREGILLHWCTPDMLDRLPQSPGLGGLLRRHAAQHPPPPPCPPRPAPRPAGPRQGPSSMSWGSTSISRTPTAVSFWGCATRTPRTRGIVGAPWQVTVRGKTRSVASSGRRGRSRGCSWTARGSTSSTWSTARTRPRRVREPSCSSGPGPGPACRR